ncbi:serine palmitoyltransferase 1 isoform X1 [Hydra vulgaris]|uniref:serine palmitoyltransferase 1 isoform X1 n=1 Tax=Hydra vulgaris TaxID=6087 RepID=UPI001F5EE641|nr:serine palmitoyltransferase 1 [Hydra vulgaris]
MVDVTETPSSIVSLSLWAVKFVEYVEFHLKVPFYHIILEVLLFVWIVRLLTRKSYIPKESRLELTKEEEDKIIAEWEPQPLVPKDLIIPEYVQNPKLISGKPAYRIIVDGKDCLNLSSMNFLGFVGNNEIEDSSIAALHKYGVGTCGPRGFYGTIDVHLNLEKKIADFLETEEAILYSYGFSTVSSAIPAYSKRTDVIFCDKGVSFAIQKGIVASRSRVYWFDHNDMEDLERKLKEQHEKDIKNPKKAAVTRRFLVVEGIYANYGDIVPLPKLIELKNKYKVRVFIDESFSFGVLGARGKGVTDHFNIPLSEIDLVTVSLETSLGSVGGFCAGSSFVVDHQRLSGQGYCFSASLPPLLAVAAETGLTIMEKNPAMFSILRENSQRFRQELQGLHGLKIEGEDFSPVIHLRLIEDSSKRLTNNEKEEKLEAIVQLCLQKNVSITVARYLKDMELFQPEPSIRICINSKLSEEDIISSATIIKEAAVYLL